MGVYNMPMIGAGAKVAQNVAPISSGASPLGFEPDYILSNMKGLDSALDSGTIQHRSFNFNAQEGGITSRNQNAISVSSCFPLDITMKGIICKITINSNGFETDFYISTLGVELATVWNVPALTTGEIEDLQDQDLDALTPYYLGVDYGGAISSAWDNNNITAVFLKR